MISIERPRHIRGATGLCAADYLSYVQSAVAAPCSRSQT